MTTTVRTSRAPSSPRRDAPADGRSGIASTRVSATATRPRTRPAGFPPRVRTRRRHAAAARGSVDASDPDPQTIRADGRDRRADRDLGAHTWSRGQRRLRRAQDPRVAAGRRVERESAPVEAQPADVRDRRAAPHDPPARSVEHGDPHAVPPRHRADVRHPPARDGHTAELRARRQHAHPDRVRGRKEDDVGRRPRPGRWPPRPPRARSRARSRSRGQSARARSGAARCPSGDRRRPACRRPSERRRPSPPRRSAPGRRRAAAPPPTRPSHRADAERTRASGPRRP